MTSNNKIIENSEQIVCEACGCNVFFPGYFLLEVSAALSPTGERAVAPTMSVFICTNCGEEFVDQSLKEEDDKENS